MSLKTSAIFTDTGHQAILESIREKYQLEIIDIFKIRFTLCALATTRKKEKIFIKIKGFRKNKRNEANFHGAINANKMAAKIKSNIMPNVFKIDVFERDNILWLNLLSVYGGEPINQGHFFNGDDAIIDLKIIKRLRNSIEVIQQTPSMRSEFSSTHKVRMVIKAMFGPRMVSDVPELASAHCDLHWGNILEGGSLIDWDMFSQAPKGFDAASLLLFSASNTCLFERLYREFSDILDNDSGQVATLFAAARMLRVMGSNAYSDWRVYEPNIREAVMLIVRSPRIRWPKDLFH